MKATCSFLFLILFLSLPASGDVVVYRKSISQRYVGPGGSLSVTGGGLIVIDPATRTGYSVSTFRFRGQKIFSVQPFEAGLRFYSVTGPSGRTYSVNVGSAITNKMSGFEDQIEFAIGANVPLAITATNTVELPRTITFLGRAVLVPTGESAVAVQGSGVASFSKTETRLANGQSETPAATLARYKDYLISRGYQEQTE